MSQSSHQFRVDLRGIIDLLSNHIYGGPQVYVRELLQNAVDAIQARRYQDPEHRGHIELHTSIVDERHVLICEENGIGLTEDEIHRFLATIGESSKRQGLGEPRERADFIGQFGIGLLSCFVVSDEIEVLTRSSKQPDAPTMLWRGRADGTYEIETATTAIEPGTRVTLRAQKGMEDWLKRARVLDLAKHFGALLPLPIKIDGEQINETQPPWAVSYPNKESQDKAVRAFAQDQLGLGCYDWVPLKDQETGIEGFAFILPFAPNLASRQQHKVYLKGMLVSDKIDNLLPEWAFFVRCVISSDHLRPTASRESFYEDETLHRTRDAIGRRLREWLIDLVNYDQSRFYKLLEIHQLSIKSLATHNDEFFDLVIDWLPFESSLGVMKLSEYRSRSTTLTYCPTVSQFRQISPIATAQGTLVLNAAYTHDIDLLEKASQRFDMPLQKLEASDLVQTFEDVELETRNHAFAFLEQAKEALQPFGCVPALKKFFPSQLPVLYSVDAAFLERREIEQVQAISDELWGGVLGDLLSQKPASNEPTLCFNYENRLVRKLLEIDDEEMMRMAAKLLYAQSLLLGHHPMSAAELELLNQGIIGLLEWGLSASVGWAQ